MNQAQVIDTNVLMVADNRADHVHSGTCVEACISALEQAIKRGLVVIDDGYLILEEYRRTVGWGSLGPGGAFLKWLWSNQANDDACRRAPLTPRGNDGDFVEFPDDPALQGFDHDDRKFVAVALSSGLAPPILNATDSDWWHHREVLARHAVTVRFLCQDLMPQEP